MVVFEALAQTRLLRRATSLPPLTLCFVNTALRRGLTQSHAVLLVRCAVLRCCASPACPTRLASSSTRRQGRGDGSLLLQSILRTSCHWWQLVRYNCALRVRTSVSHALSRYLASGPWRSAYLRRARRCSRMQQNVRTWSGVRTNASSRARAHFCSELACGWCRVGQC